MMTIGISASCTPAAAAGIVRAAEPSVSTGTRSSNLQESLKPEP